MLSNDYVKDIILNDRKTFLKDYKVSQSNNLSDEVDDYNHNNIKNY